jgi:hypothetical protein
MRTGVAQCQMPGPRCCGNLENDEDTAALRLIPVTIPELLRQLRGTVIPDPRRDQAHRAEWSLWHRRHQYHAQQAHQRWHAYADKLPR